MSSLLRRGGFSLWKFSGVLIHTSKWTQINQTRFKPFVCQVRHSVSFPTVLPTSPCAVYCFCCKTALELPNQLALVVHNATTHPENKCVCHLCGSAFEDLNELDIHLKSLECVLFGNILPWTHPELSHSKTKDQLTSAEDYMYAKYAKARSQLVYSDARFDQISLSRLQELFSKEDGLKVKEIWCHEMPILKPRALYAILSAFPVDMVVIFVNSAARGYFLIRILLACQIKSTIVHHFMTFEQRSEIFSKARAGFINVLVSTDLKENQDIVVQQYGVPKNFIFKFNGYDEQLMASNSDSEGCTGNRYASSSAVTQRSSTPRGLFSWLTGERSHTLPPLDTPFHGVTLPHPLSDYVEPGKTTITTLPNGLRIASETSTNPAASIGLYVACGSIYETPISCGATHLLAKMAFKSTSIRSHLGIIREVEAIGGYISASASREQIGYSYDTLKTYFPVMLEFLVDCVMNPVFLDREIDEQIHKVKAEIEELNSNPQALLMEAIHSVGYAGALANPLLAPESAINRLNGAVLEEFVAENYTAPRMVISASGVEHEELLSIAEPLLSDLPGVTRQVEPESRYTGGDFRCQDETGTTHVALAFELPGGWKTGKEAMSWTVLQMLMGGGGGFTNTRVLNAHPQIQSFSAFNSIYNNTGLFGIHVSTASDFVPQAVDLAARELLEAATPGKVTQAELDRAKESTKSAVLMYLKPRMVVAEDIGSQILTYGERKPLAYFLEAVDDITLEDISTTVQKIVSSPLTMASWGNVVNVPSYDHVSSQFRN